MENEAETEKLYAVYTTLCPFENRKEMRSIMREMREFGEKETEICLMLASAICDGLRYGNWNVAK